MAVEITGKNFRAFSKALLHAQTNSLQTFQFDGEELNTRYSAYLIKQYGESLGYTEEDLYTLKDIDHLMTNLLTDVYLWFGGNIADRMTNWWRDKRQQYAQDTSIGEPSTEEVH